MHLWSIGMAIAIAWCLRNWLVLSAKNWSERWYRSLFLFLFPGLLIFSTAISILYMGCHGAMLGIKAGSWGCAASASLLLFAMGCLVRLIYQSQRAINHLAIYKQELIVNTFARVIDTDLPYSSQVGFWQPQLVISNGLLDQLNHEQLEAVLAHEQAHLHYRDTFWFFWLGWMRYFTFWLPNTEALWQELLLLRELRADSKAAQSVDFLLLAESLLTVVQAPMKPSAVSSAGFNEYTPGDRLDQRIDCLLAQEKPYDVDSWHNWSWICLLFLPLLTIPLHS